MRLTELSSKPELPSIARTRDGSCFDPRESTWRYRDAAENSKLDFSELPLTRELLFSLKRVMLWYAENKSVYTLRNCFKVLKHFATATAHGPQRPLGRIDVPEILNFLAVLGPHRRSRFACLRALLRRWYAFGFPGVTKEAIALLRELKIPPNPRAEAVLTMDPQLGPLTDIEFASVHAALRTALEAGHITMDSYLIASLFLAFGQRPIQYAALKVRDVVTVQSEMRTYILRIPRAKNREVLRRKFKDRVLLYEFGKLLCEHAETVSARFSSHLADPLDAPLFPETSPAPRQPPGFTFHRTAASIGRVCTKTINSLGVLSERTGKRLHMSPIRFRRTIGTRAAVEGHGAFVIAEMLDHSDLQSVRSYIKTVPGIVDRIDRAVALKLAPLAQAFTGMIISDETQAIRAGDASARISAPQFAPTMRPIGNCGKHGFCGLYAPVACYTCRNFQPWLDGPHEKVLDHLISERERLQSSTDVRIATVNDRTILAVADVVRRCREMSVVASEAINEH